MLFSLFAVLVAVHGGSGKRPETAAPEPEPSPPPTPPQGGEMQGESGAIAPDAREEKPPKVRRDGNVALNPSGVRRSHVFEARPP